MRIAEGIAQGVGQLHALHRYLFAVQPLDEEVSELLLLAGRRDGQGKARGQFRVTARRQCIANLAGDSGFRHPIQRLFIRQISGGEAAIRRPRNRHRALTLHERREVFDEAEFLDARRHEFIFGTPFGQDFYTLGIVDLRFHVRVKELAAFIAETLLEHEIAIARLAELRCAVNAFVFQRVGEKLADFAELLPGLRRRQVVAQLRLKRFLQRRIGEQIFTVIHHEHVAVVRETVNLAVHFHLVIAISRGDFLQFIAELIFVDHRVQLLEGAGLHEIGHPRRNHV